VLITPASPRRTGAAVHLPVWRQYMGIAHRLTVPAWAHFRV